MNRGRPGKKWRTKRLEEVVRNDGFFISSQCIICVYQDLENSAMLPIYYKNPQGSKYTNLQHFSFSLLSLSLFSFRHSLIGRRLPSTTLLRTRGTDIRIRITRHDQTRINRFGHVRELETNNRIVGVGCKSIDTC